MFKITLVTSFILSILIQSNVAAVPVPNTGGDVFNANPDPTLKPQFGSDASVCNDRQIAQIEKRSNTTARVFGAAASGSKEALFGRWLETQGYVYHTGVCKGRSGFLVMFIYNNQIANANRAASEFFAGNSNRQNDSNPPQSRPNTTTNSNMHPAAIARCQRVLQQQGNLRGFPSCGSTETFCQRFMRQHPTCVAIIAQQSGGVQQSVITDGTNADNIPPYPKPQAEKKYQISFAIRGSKKPFRISVLERYVNQGVFNCKPNEDVVSCVFTAYTKNNQVYIQIDNLIIKNRNGTQVPIDRSYTRQERLAVQR